MKYQHDQEKVLIKSGYSVEVSFFNGKKVIWEVVCDNAGEKGK